MADALALLALLIGLELVLGVDNIPVIAVFAGRLPQRQRQKARILGLGLALAARIGLLALVVFLVGITRPLTGQPSARGLILIGGGLFLINKAVKEIHHTITYHEDDEAIVAGRGAIVFRSVISRIVLLDIVFSIDSMITAMGRPGSCGSSWQRWSCLLWRYSSSADPSATLS